MHTFGWGRRTCLGKDIVDDEMFVTGASVLWGFTMSQKTCPRTGEPVPIDTQATNSHVILEPSQFYMDFKPRTPERAKLILDGYATVQPMLKV